MLYVLNLIAAIHARLDRDENDRGATATEYALLVSFIAIALIVGVTAFGGALGGFFNSLATHVGLLNN